MEFYKPAILIGLLYEAEPLLERYAEVALGIEEEGCLSDQYRMEDEEDIRYSISDTTIVLLEHEGRLFVNELNKHNCLLSAAEDYRLLGRNAARYLKKMKLCL